MPSESVCCTVEAAVVRVSWHRLLKYDLACCLDKAELPCRFASDSRSPNFFGICLPHARNETVHSDFSSLALLFNSNALPINRGALWHHVHAFNTLSYEASF
jgi:hypothetical protein